MRVLQINTEKTWRGGERQTLATLQGLLEVGVDAHLLCRAGTPLQARALACVHEGRVHAMAGKASALAFLARKGRAFQVLHAQTAQAQTLAVAAKPLHGRPVLYTRRVDFVPRGRLARLKYARTDRVVAISRAIARILQEQGLARPQVVPSAALPGCAPEAALAAARRELAAMGLGRGPQALRLLGTFAALVEHKDPLNMARAVRRLAEQRQDFAFLHFGEGPLRRDLEAYLRGHGLEARYRLMGFRDDVMAWLPLLDVFAMSSQEEGLGSSVLDAFLHGVPVVATDAGGLPELLGEESERGLLCPRRDPVALAAALGRMLDDGALRGRASLEARAFAAQRHDPLRLARRYAEIYREMLDAP